MPSVREIRFRQDLQRAFPEDASLIKDIQSVVTHHPDTVDVFQRLLDHIASKSPDESERASKRLKTEHEPVLRSDPSSITTENPKPQLTITELSFVTPLRKKLTLHISESSILVVQPADPQKHEIDVPVNDIRSIVLLPVPEKAARLFNFCIFQKSSEDTVVFTVPDIIIKNASGPAMSVDGAINQTYKSLVSQVFKQVIRLTVIEPNPSDFVSAIPQPHRKQEPAVHVTAHRGPKEGYLYFLPTGLVYGFKRPLLYIELADILSVTYNDILQRTFNLTVTVQMEDKTEEYEFSMIDAIEHDRVAKYVTKYRLNDQSLAESRKAKLINAKGNEQRESEISKAAEEIATSVEGHPKEESDEEGDEDFQDDVSHGGSTLASDESDLEEDDEQE